MEVNFSLPKHPVGTKFTWVRSRKVKHEATVVGYHLEYNTDHAEATYRIQYDIGLQIMTATVARSTVDMAVAKQ